MKLSEIYKNSRRAFSFEFFPPKTPEGEVKLFETVRDLKGLSPSFVSVTYGAMGSTRSNTQRIVSRIKQELGIEAAAHLTCVTHTREEMDGILHELKLAGVENIVALRGDPPKGETEFRPVAGGFPYASELVRYIRSKPEFSGSFSLSIARLWRPSRAPVTSSMASISTSLFRISNFFS
jgi:methylenetetrahydrofolate reductase (NADPH)